MGAPKYTSPLFKHTLVCINKILPMEHAIRAIKRSAPDQYQALESIDIRLTEFWQQRGFNDAQIKAFELKDLSWDLLQFGRPYSRQHSQVYHPSLIDRFSEGIKKIEEFEEDVSKLQLPVAVKNFRYCDLINGNDIPRTLAKVQDISAKLDRYEDEKSILANDFANFIRMPKMAACDEYLILDGAGAKTRKGEELDNAIMLLVRTDEPIADFKNMLNDFSWEYGKKRSDYLREHPEAKRDALPHKLIQSVLDAELFNTPDLKINRHDGLMRPLVGLYCWDMVQKSFSWTEILDELSEKHNIDFDIATVRKYHKDHKVKIEALIKSGSK